jgi:hypothetical protein
MPATDLKKAKKEQKIVKPKGNLQWVQDLRKDKKYADNIDKAIERTREQKLHQDMS